MEQRLWEIFKDSLDFYKNSSTVLTFYTEISKHLSEIKKPQMSPRIFLGDSFESLAKNEIDAPKNLNKKKIKDLLIFLQRSKDPLMLKHITDLVVKKLVEPKELYIWHSENRMMKWVPHLLLRQRNAVCPFV